jgi:hypothetical protein
MARVSASIGAGGAANQRVDIPETHPSVAYLMLLIILEYAALVAMRYFFRTVHGG